MAPKRLLEDPPSAASTEDDDTESDAVEEKENGVSDGVENDEEEEESEDEEGEEDEKVDDHRSKKFTTNKSTVATPSKASDRQSSSSGSGDESGSESDSESGKTQPSPSASDFTIKPIMSKPIDDSGKPQKSAAKRDLTPAPTKAVSKRTNEGDIEEKDSKKKKVPNGQDEDVRKGAGRLWSEDDEIVIVKGMIDYKSKKGADPFAEMGMFHEFIKKNLHADVSKSQLMEKIRRLKKKYQIIAEKSEDGKDPVFSKPHERKFYELSKKIWGPASANGVDDNAKNKRKPTQSKVSNSSAIASPKLNGDIKVETEKACSNSSLLDGLLFSGKLLSQPEAAISIMKESLPLIGSSKAKELESKWVKFQEDEFQLYLKRIELVHESAKLLLEAKKSSTF